MLKQIRFGGLGLIALALAAPASASKIASWGIRPLPKVEIKRTTNGKCDVGWRFERDCAPPRKCFARPGVGSCVKTPSTDSGHRAEVLAPTQGKCPADYHLHTPTCPPRAMCKMSMPMCRLGQPDSIPTKTGKCDAGYRFVAPSCPPWAKCVLRPGVGTCQRAPNPSHPGQLNEPEKGKCADGATLVKPPCRGGWMCRFARPFCRPAEGKGGVLGRILEAHQRVLSGVEKLDLKVQRQVYDLYQQARRLVFSPKIGPVPPRKCPMFRCMMPRCKANQELKDSVLSNGCRGCSTCANRVDKATSVKAPIGVE